MNDRELTQLQETGSVTLSTPVNLGMVLGGLDSLGIEAGLVRVHTDHRLGRQITLTLIEAAGVTANHVPPLFDPARQEALTVELDEAAALVYADDSYDTDWGRVR
jgi:hypothetical protein